MDEPTVRQLLEALGEGTVTVDQALQRLRRLPFADLGFARIDHQRSLRIGFPEAVYGPGKTPEQCAAIVVELLAGGGGPVILTRADDAQVKAALAAAEAEGHPAGAEVRTGQRSIVTWRPAATGAGEVLILTAGTADLDVADECRATLAALGYQPTLRPDCGVAGLHRLLAALDELAAAEVVVVVAGMEGALASVVGGLTPAPVIAVPTSTGYGAGLQGVTALLAMLASCASGVSVVGIDNGYGAACAAARHLQSGRRRPS